MRDLALGSEISERSVLFFEFRQGARSDFRRILTQNHEFQGSLYFLARRVSLNLL